MKKYAVRYYIGEWNKPIPNLKDREQIIPGVSCVDPNVGYADEVFTVSIVIQPDGSRSMLMMDSVSQCGQPPREMLEGVRDLINHHLEHHMEKPK